MPASDTFLNIIQRSSRWTLLGLAIRSIIIFSGESSQFAKDFKSTLRRCSVNSCSRRLCIACPCSAIFPPKPQASTSKIVASVVKDTWPGIRTPGWYVLSTPWCRIVIRAKSSSMNTLSLPWVPPNAMPTGLGRASYTLPMRRWWL